MTEKYINISSPATFDGGKDFSDTVNYAFDFCQRYGVTIKAKVISERPDGIGNDWGGWKYKMIMRRNNKQYTFYFTDPVWKQKKGLLPNCYDVLACLTKYMPGSLEDFINEFGYEITSYESFKDTDRAYKAVKREAAAMARLFGTDTEAFEELCNIQ